MPLATIDASDSEIFVEMTFNCQALSPKMVTMMLYEWSSAKGPILSGTIDNNQAFGEGLSRFQWKTKAKAGERPVIKLKLEPAGFLEPYKAGCQIELVKNSAQAI